MSDGGGEAHWIAGRRRTTAQPGPMPSSMSGGGGRFETDREVQTGTRLSLGSGKGQSRGGALRVTLNGRVKTPLRTAESTAVDHACRWREAHRAACVRFRAFIFW